MPTTYWLKFGNTPLGYNGKALKRTYAPPGSLSVTCNTSVSGAGFDTTKQFGCTVTFNAVVPYTLDGVAQTPASSVHLLLTKDQTAVLGGIPAGTTYSIAEDALPQSDQGLGYFNGAVAGAAGTIGEGTTSSASIGFTYVEMSGVIVFQFAPGYDPSTAADGARPRTLADIGWSLHNVDATQNIWVFRYPGNLPGSALSPLSSSATNSPTSSYRVVSIDTTGWTNFSVLFAFQPYLTEVPLFDISQGSILGMFHGCSSLANDVEWAKHLATTRATYASEADFSSFITGSPHAASIPTDFGGTKTRRVVVALTAGTAIPAGDSVAVTLRPGDYVHASSQGISFDGATQAYSQAYLEWPPASGTPMESSSMDSPTRFLSTKATDLTTPDSDGNTVRWGYPEGTTMVLNGRRIVQTPTDKTYANLYVESFEFI